jgi:hypothetical protein
MLCLGWTTSNTVNSSRNDHGRGGRPPARKRPQPTTPIKMNLVCSMAANPGALDPKSAPKHTTWTKIRNSWAAQYGTRPGGISVVAVVWTSAGPLRIPTQYHTDGHSVRHAKLQSCRPAACCPGAHLAPSRKGRGQLPPCYPKTWRKTRRLGPGRVPC